MRINWVILMAGLLLGGAAVAEPPARTPGRGPMGPHRPAGEDHVSWEEVEAFMKETSPRRYAAMLALPVDQQERMRESVRMMYRLIRWSRNDPALWEAKKREVGIEDELFELRMELLHKQTLAEQQDVRDAMRARVRQLVELRLEERAARVARLRSLAAEEESRLESDRQSMHELVEARLKEEIESSAQFGRPPERPERPRRSRDKEAPGPDR
jgi:hypothetical protein